VTGTQPPYRAGDSTRLLVDPTNPGSAIVPEM
jgi:hypothetical protein